MNPHRIRRPVLFLAFATLAFAASAQQPPANPEFKQYLDQGREALKSGRYKDAIDALKKADALQNNSCGECRLFMAIAYFRSKDFKRTLENCDKAINELKDKSALAAAHSMKGSLIAAEAGSDSKKLSLAESEFRAVLALEPSSPVFHMNLARVLLRELKDDDAKIELQACLALNPDEGLSREARLVLADTRRGREEMAPEFAITTVQGQKISLNQLAGRVVVMDFWATWCPPCRESVPELKELTKRYSGDKLVLISISADADARAWEEFIAKKKMDWAQYRDTDHKVLDAFGIRAFPSYLVIDGDGFVRSRLTGLNPQETVVHRLKATLEQMPELEGEARK